MLEPTPLLPGLKKLSAVRVVDTLVLATVLCKIGFYPESALVDHHSTSLNAEQQNRQAVKSWIGQSNVHERTTELTKPDPLV